MTRVMVTGANGRMGRQVVQAVGDAPDMEVVAQADPEIIPDGVTLFTSVEEALAATKPDVAVDFTIPAVAFETVGACLRAGVHCVVGTTGMTDGQMADLTDLAQSGDANLVVAANFAVGAVLMMRFAELAAPFFDTAEIIELHHDQKVDAPSGTAVTTAQRMAAASADWAADPTQHEVYPGARGGVGPAGIHVHAVRMRGMVAHQEVILGAQGQSLTIRQDSYDRASFMPGVVLACKRVGEFRGLTLGLDALLGV